LGFQFFKVPAPRGEEIGIF